MKRNIFLTKFKKELNKSLDFVCLRFKLQSVCDKINTLELKYMTSDERIEVKYLTSIARDLNISLNSVKPVINVYFDNSGARHDYGIGAYNGD